MSAERDDPPALRTREAEVIDLEMMDDDAGSGEETMSAQDFLKMGPDMVSQFLRNLMMEKLKKWFIRNLAIFTVLAVLSIEYKWANTIMSIWAFIAGVYLAILLFGWYMGNKQAAKLSQMMKGFTPPPGGGPDLQ